MPNNLRRALQARTVACTVSYTTRFMIGRTVGRTVGHTVGRTVGSRHVQCDGNWHGRIGGSCIIRPSFQPPAPRVEQEAAHFILRSIFHVHVQTLRLAHVSSPTNRVI